jgi:hypothetical protein
MTMYYVYFVEFCFFSKNYFQHSKLSFHFSLLFKNFQQNGKKLTKNNNVNEQQIIFLVYEFE